MNPKCIALCLWLACASNTACAEKKPPPPPPPKVLVARVVRQDLPLFIEAVGTLDGYVNADIRARVKGYLRSQNYKDGSSVREGDLLFTIEPDEYANAVASARAAVVRGDAAKANGKVSLDRNNLLEQQGLVSKQTLDNAVAQAADANGQVLEARATLSQAELNLSYTKIHAPVAGVAGLALVRVGNLVGQDGSNPADHGVAGRPDSSQFPNERDRLRALPRSAQAPRAARRHLGA